MARTQIPGDELLDSSITDADISASANIAGTKISANFGLQNVKAVGYYEIGALSNPGGLAGTARLYFDVSTNKLRVSENGGSFVDLIGSSVSGTGVSGRATFWDGTNSLSSDSAFTFDTTFKTLKVGTSSFAQLHGGTGTITVDRSGVGAAIFTVGTNVGESQLGSNGSFRFRSGPSGNPALYLTGASQLAGIRTENPQSTLHILSASASALRIDADGAINPYIELRHGSSPASSSAIYFMNQSGTVLSTIGGGQSIYIDSQDHHFRGAGGGSDRVTISNAGRLGINAGSPESLLDVGADSGKWARFGDNAWSLRIGQQANGSQWLGMGVNKTAADNTWRAMTGNNALVTHSVLELPFDGGLNFHQQGHQSDGTALSPSVHFRIDAVGRVAVGTASPASSAAFEVSSSSRGFLPPRMASPSGAITSPAAGLLAYNTTTNTYQFYNGSIWTGMGGGGTGDIDKIITSFANGDPIVSFVTGNIMYLQ